MKSLLRPAFLAIVCLLAAAGALAADAAAGKGSYLVCAACHGQNGEGNQALNAPRLAGQEGWYIKRQLAAYNAGMRGTKPGDIYGMQMRNMANTVSGDAAIENLIAYIDTLAPPASTPTVSGDAAVGKALYAVCAACHGQQAEGLEQMGGPRLAGQSDWYLVRQLQSYKNGLRGYHEKDTFGRQMASMGGTLVDDAAINNVVAYINSLAQ